VACAAFSDAPDEARLLSGAGSWVPVPGHQELGRGVEKSTARWWPRSRRVNEAGLWFNASHCTITTGRRYPGP